MKRSRVAVALFTAFVLTGCGFGGAESTGPGIIGLWSGSLVLGNQEHPLTVTILRDNGDVFTGTYLCLSAGAGGEQCPTGPQATDQAIGIAGSTTGGFIGTINADINSNTSCDFLGTISDVLIQGTYSCTNDENGTWSVGK